MRQSIKIRLLLLFIRLLGLLPLRANHALGAGIGWLLARLPNRARREARVNLGLCFPHLSEAERQRMLEQSLIETAKTATEVAYFWTRSPECLERLAVEVRGQKLMEAARAQGRGVLVAVPHLGSWEYLGLFWARRVALSSLYRPPRRPQYEALITWARQRTGATLLPTTPSGIRRLYKALARGEVAAILPDQEPPGQGVFVPFFGRPAKTMTLLSKLAAQSQAPVLFAFAERLPRGRGYRIHLAPAPEAIAAADPLAAARALNQGVEACVAVAPTQYQWTYRRFRRQPDGSRDPYSHAPL